MSLPNPTAEMRAAPGCVRHGGRALTHAETCEECASAVWLRAFGASLRMRSAAWEREARRAFEATAEQSGRDNA